MQRDKLGKNLIYISLAITAINAFSIFSQFHDESNTGDWYITPLLILLLPVAFISYIAGLFLITSNKIKIKFLILLLIIITIISSAILYALK